MLVENNVKPSYYLKVILIFFMLSCTDDEMLVALNENVMQRFWNIAQEIALNYKFKVGQIVEKSELVVF
jgi:hypothetical protein